MNIKNKWISAYIFHQGYLYSYESDRVIMEIVKPFIEMCYENSWIKNYFFIRYSEGGTHIRLRFYGEESILENTVKKELEIFLKKNFPKELEVDSPDYELLKWVDYEPEIERYGGAHAIKIAEEYFNYSSIFCIELLEGVIDGNNSQRLGKGLIATNLIIYTFTESREIGYKLAEQYHKGYLSAVARQEDTKNDVLELFKNGFDKQAQNLIEFNNNLWEVLDSDGEIPENFKVFLDNLKSIKSKLQQIDSEGKLIEKESSIDLTGKLFRIIPSYIHMMNNRLGISIPEESYLTYLITNALQTQLPEGETIDG